MINKKYSYNHSSTLSVIFLSLCLAGCASDPYKVEPALGKSVRDAITQQIFNPEAPRERVISSGTDGVILKSSMDRYQTSYEVPPPPVNVMNIGLGNSSGTSGR